MSGYLSLTGVPIRISGKWRALRWLQELAGFKDYGAEDEQSDNRRFAWRAGRFRGL